jgi:hypothetical protein
VFSKVSRQQVYTQKINREETKSANGLDHPFGQRNRDWNRGFSRMPPRAASTMPRLTVKGRRVVHVIRDDTLKQ